MNLAHCIEQIVSWLAIAAAVGMIILFGFSVYKLIWLGEPSSLIAWVAFASGAALFVAIGSGKLDLK